MLNKKIVAIGAIIPFAFMVGCSSSSNNPSNSDGDSSSSQAIDINDEDDDDIKSSNSNTANGSSNSENQEVNGSSDSDGLDSIPEAATSCQATKLGKTDQATLDLAGSYIIDILDAYANGDTDFAKAYGKKALTSYKVLLEESPKNCDVQLGYAATSVINLANNGVLNELLSISDSERERISHLSAGQMLERIEAIVKEGTGKSTSLTAQTQKEITESILPTVNAAIQYFKNIMEVKDYTYTVKSEDEVRQLDMSEFGQYLGYLYIAKAACTAIASLELELRQDGSYEWIDDVNHISSSKMTSAQVEAVEIAMATVGVDGIFGKVKSKWESEWKTVPDYLDSAITFMKKGYEFSLTDDDQENDVYIVGNGYDADLSFSDVKEMISNLNTKKDELHGTYEYEYAKGRTILVSVAKLFKITDGVAGFLPYYEYDGDSDLSTFKFTDAKGKVLATLADFKNHKYTARDAADLIIFPDPTFGGVFPGATNDDIWDMLIESQTIKF